MFPNFKIMSSVKFYCVIYVTIMKQNKIYHEMEGFPLLHVDQKLVRQQCEPEFPSYQELSSPEN